MSVFDPSPARRGLDLLLLMYPHLDLVSATSPGDDELGTPWLIIELGQPSEGKVEAYARWRYALLKKTGAVYRFDPDGAVQDDPFIEP